MKNIILVVFFLSIKPMFASDKELPNSKIIYQNHINNPEKNFYFLYKILLDMCKVIRDGSSREDFMEIIDRTVEKHANDDNDKMGNLYEYLRDIVVFSESFVFCQKNISLDDNEFLLTLKFEDTLDRLILENEFNPILIFNILLFDNKKYIYDILLKPCDKEFLDHFLLDLSQFEINKEILTEKIKNYINILSKVDEMIFNHDLFENDGFGVKSKKRRQCNIQ